ncbi:retrovirus-related pol polyprotein from transposon TNT 1-94 [Tanacetum coccineum]|uniref:Retrovirus-related pol polyprotein from transposon TNT 1-94 n=1 Tax=Tanacetum coccineum TaxID=301880 RepID=A0ABQ5BNF2_9ASTR
MSNTNNNLQTQTSNSLHNAIMEAGGKDRPPMLAPGNYNLPYKFKWTKRTIPVAEGSSKTTTKWYMENYKNVSKDIRNQLDAEAEAVQIILTWIDNDIYSIVDAFPNEYDMWKAIGRLKQGESINVQDLKTNLYWEFGKFTSRDGETLESYYSRFYKMMNELNKVDEIRAKRLACTANPLALVAQQQPVYHPQSHPTHYTQNSLTRSQQAATRNRGKAIKDIDKLMALNSLLFKKIYKPTNNNLRTSSNTSKANQYNTLRINKGTWYDNQRAINVAGARDSVARECQKLKRVKDVAYHKEKMPLCKQEEAGNQLSTEQADWRDDTDDEPEDQELEAHYLYMAKIQEHITGNLKLLSNFVEKFLGTVKFGNDQIALILDLEVAFWKSTCYISYLKGNDLLTGSRGTDLYSITLQNTTSSNLICLMAKASWSQAWLWHRCLSHLKFDTINLLLKYDIMTCLPKLKFVKDHLCSSCELGKAKRKSFKTKTTPSSKRRLQILHMDLCGPMRVKSFNGKKYMMVIGDDNSKYTWTHFLRSNDKTPEVLIDFLKLVQRGLHAQVRTVRTDKGT